MTQEDLATDDVMILDTWGPGKSNESREETWIHNTANQKKNEYAQTISIFLSGVCLDRKRGPRGGED